MINMGFKVDNSRKEKRVIKELLNYFKHNPQYLLEIGFYHKRNELGNIFEEYCHDEYYRINTHNQHNNSVISLYQGTEKLIEELSAFKALNSNYSIIHLTESKETEDLFSEQELVNKAVPLIEKLNEIARQFHYHYYIENTYHSIDFYHRLFDIIRRKELDRIHFCFDIGHAKVWSGNIMNEWFDFLGDLKSKNINLHFHLHLNNGNADDHLSFMECNHTGGDRFSNYVNYENLMRSLIYRFPIERKIFEVKTKFAVPNIQYIQRLLKKEKIAS